MADAEGKKDSQQAHATNALSYGHFGTATYELNARKWSFLRRCVDRGTFHSAFPFVTVQRETVYGNSADWNELPPRNHSLSSYSVAGQGPHPLPDCPGLDSADFRVEESLSSAITTSLGQYDPLMSDRLGFGSASWLLDNDVRSGNATVPIAALASGANGECIVLTQIGSERVTVTDENDRELVLKIPKITGNRQTHWTSNGEAVLQICFAATSGYQSTWMAARLLSSTTIFHPLFHRRPFQTMTQSSNLSSGIQHSLLDANPILTIPVSRTGGHPHADVSFHPANCHMVALIDQHGNWSTWQIDGKRSVTTRALFKIQLLRTGKLYTWEILRRPPLAHPYHDGWHKICWAADDSGYFDRVFLANRRDAVIHAPLDEETYPIGLGLGQINEAQWILDVKKSALHSGWIFILTSTRVLCLSTINNEWRAMPKTDSHTILCSWQHFRSRRDITLSLTLLETAHCTVILLSSHVNPIVNAYRIDAPSEHSASPLSWVEPSLLDISDNAALLGLQHVIGSPRTLLMRPVQIQRPSKASDEPLTLSLHKLFILQADRGVSEVLLQGIKEPSGFEGHNNPNTIHLPLESYVRSRSSKYAEVDDLDDYIVQDGEAVLHTYPGLHEERDEQRYREQDRPASEVASTINLQEACEPINRDPSTSELSQKRVQLDDYIQTIRPKLERSVSIEPGMRLLSDLSSPLLLVVDVEASSAMIAALAESVSTNGQALSLLYRMPVSAGSNSALELYQSLVSDWLSHLPREVPDRIRVNKERLARNVAADLALAGIAAGPSVHELETHVVRERIYPDSAPPATVTLAPGLDLDIASTTVRSQPLSSLPFVAEEHPACVRLRAYTTISHNAVTTATPASVLDMLAHLPSDAEIDPLTYDWRATKADITAEQDQSAETADPRVRRRAEKLAQAKRRRVQLQTEAAEELVRQRAPPAIGSSQMVLPTREVQSSQVAPPESPMLSDLGPMTQPERGIFGTRIGGPAAGRKDKGKRREAGF